MCAYRKHEYVSAFKQRLRGRPNLLVAQPLFPCCENPAVLIINHDYDNELKTHTPSSTIIINITSTINFSSHIHTHIHAAHIQYLFLPHVTVHFC